MRSLLAPLAALIPAHAAPAAAQSVDELKECACLTHDQALAKLRSSPEGLLSREAIDRLLTYGPNTVAHEARKSAPRRLLEQFFTPLSILLLVLATVFYLSGEIKGAVVTPSWWCWRLAFVFRGACSSKAAERLRAMVSTTAMVLEWTRQSAQR
jgi:Mg2+-importing ATPase